MVRVFLSVPLPKKLKGSASEEINDVKTSLSDWEINWISPDNLHVTLLFFGWIEEGQIKILKEEIGAATKDFPAFEISTAKLNTRNRSIWIEIKKGQDKLIDLQERIKERLTIKGSEEFRPFHPHLTIGRVKKRGKQKALKVKEPLSWEANRLILYKSKLKKSGPVYTKLEIFRLDKRA